MKYKVPIIERIGNILQTTEFSLFITRSAIIELGNLPDGGDTIFSDARQFGLDECEVIERVGQNTDQSYDNDNDNDNENDNDNDNDKFELTPSHDIQNLVKDGNKEGYFVATQDKVLSDTLRDMIYVPQMWLTTRGGVLIFDTPSAASRKFAQREERVKQKTGGGTMTQEESDLIRRLKEKNDGRNNNNDNNNNSSNRGGDGGNANGNSNNAGIISVQRKKRKAKGPNPLSCKKKKTETKQVTVEKRKRRRRKKTSDE